MKQMILLFLFTLSFDACFGVEVSVGAQQYAPMDFTIGVLKSDCNITPIADQLKKDLELSSQFKVTTKLITVVNNANLRDLAKASPLAIFINLLDGVCSDKKWSAEWRLYDLISKKMIAGKKVQANGLGANEVAHVIADQVWPELTKAKSSFSTTIVACRKTKDGDKNKQSIYAFHPTDNLKDKVPIKVIKNSTINFAPRWHPTKKLLYYSQHTPTNVRLMAVNENLKNRVVTNFDGLNMTPAISPSGKIVVSLTSNGYEKLYEYRRDEDSKTNKFTALTDSSIYAISPSFIDDDKLVFCAIDARRKIPRIAILDTSKSQATYLTGREFCVSPSYCAEKNQIIYCKKTKGVQQIFTYDLNSEEHFQLTYDSGDKDECSWSPCGNYVVFTIDSGKGSRVALWNRATNKHRCLTPATESWSFPAWSPKYGEKLFL